MPLCRNCGAQQPLEAKFCDECGSRMRETPLRVAYAGSSLSAAKTHPPTVPASLQGRVPETNPTCGSCGTTLEPDSAFCHHCGAPAGTSAAPARERATEVQSWIPLPELRLVVGQNQATVRFPRGKSELVLGRNDPMAGVFPDFDLTPFNGAMLGVSRRHARLSFEGGQLYIEDNASTNHTHVQDLQLAPHAPHPLNSGDEVRLGRLVLVIFIQPTR